VYFIIGYNVQMNYCHLTCINLFCLSVCVYSMVTGHYQEDQALKQGNAKHQEALSLLNKIP